MLHLGHTVLHMDTHPASYRVALAVREHLRRAGKTQLDVVDATGIPRTTLNRRMTGNSPFTISELELIAAFLGITVTEIMQTSEQAA